jgi:hypothetical protein
MASAGDGSQDGHPISGGGDGGAKENVADLMMRLNLTEEEGVVVDFSDDDETADPVPMEWAVIGKVLSPSIVHVNTVRAAMRLAWVTHVD